MKYVLDSSVAFKAIVPEAHSDKAIKLRDEFRQGLHELLAPDVFPIEIGHALTKAERQGRVSMADGFLLWTQAMKDAPQIFPSLPLMPRAYALSSQARIGIYDCLYVALSEQEQCKIVTDDNRLHMLFPSRVVLLSSL